MIFAFRRVCCLILSLFCILPASAQTKKPAPKTPGGFTYSGDLSLRAGGARLQANARGLARVQSPELDVRAQVIGFDLVGNAVSEVRAQKDVNFKLDATPSGGASGGGQPLHVEATCNNAVLTPKPFKLVLTGALNGFYQLQNGARTALSGEAATITSPNGILVADLVGGAAAGVRLSVPATAFGQPGQVGDVTVTAQRAHVDQSAGTVTFSGNAHAVSQGADAFDVTATQFILTRSADGQIATIQTIGRTLAKLDVPPDPTPTTPAVTAAPVASAASAPSATKKPAATTAASVGKPTHIEVAADGALIDLSTSTATFTGNVKGFYRLAPAVGAAQNYDFTGDKATIRYLIPTTPGAPGSNALSGLSVQVSDAQVEAPAFNFGF